MYRPNIYIPKYAEEPKNPGIIKLITECASGVDLKAVCEQMGRSPEWMPDIQLRADGYETEFYKKD